MEYQIAEKT